MQKIKKKVELNTDSKDNVESNTSTYVETHKGII